MSEAEEKILPCPFCGSAATFEWNGDEGLGFVECDNVSDCGAQGRIDDFESAIQWWNRRPDPNGEHVRRMAACWNACEGIDTGTLEISRVRSLKSRLLP